MGCERVDELGYSLLRDLRLEIDGKEASFTLCFWVFLPRTTSFPCTILYQSHSETPFISLNEDKRLTLSPSFSLHNETPGSDGGKSVTNIFSVVLEEDFPLGQWVHLGCEVTNNSIRVHIDGEIKGERSLDPSTVKEADYHGFARVTLFAGEGNDDFDGYVYNVNFLPLTSSVKEHHVKDPPLRLCLDSSSATGIEVDCDGVWSIVGGKAAGRKIFSLNVLLLDAFGNPVDREVEVVAGLIYANDRAPVENSEDAEAPLLISCGGLEFPSACKPIKLSRGCASFKMKMSQLSSKCDNKLFCIKFGIPKLGSYHFFEALSPPIRCMSKARFYNQSTITWKKLSSGVHLFNGSISPKYGGGSLELQQNAICEARPNPPSKRVKLGQDSPLTVSKPDASTETPDEQCNSCTVAPNKVHCEIRTSLESIQENYGEMDNSASDSENVGARKSELKNMPCSRELITDLNIFRYCLGSLSERTVMLKEIASFVSQQDMVGMAEQVAFSSGCSHHRYQIMMAKRLLEEGDKIWNLISRNSPRAHWDNVVFEIEEQFMRIACCSSRSLTQQDFNFLKRISGGLEYMTRDDFDKLWRWLCPVAFTISQPGINPLWASMSPRWIEGFVTKEEVEYALQNPMGTQEPGTFFLRFPSSRSWPHPDAGSLVASYVGRDLSLHHRQLSLDYSSGMFSSNTMPLQELLLSEPELSRLGRITRSDLTV